MPVYCQFTATLLPLFFQLISFILFCIFSGRVNAQSIVAYNRITFLLRVKICQANRIFQLTERSFDSPYADILEMPIFAFLKYWIYRTL